MNKLVTSNLSLYMYVYIFELCQYVLFQWPSSFSMTCRSWRCRCRVFKLKCSHLNKLISKLKHAFNRCCVFYKYLSQQRNHVDLKQQSNMNYNIQFENVLYVSATYFPIMHQLTHVCSCNPFIVKRYSSYLCCHIKEANTQILKQKNNRLIKEKNMLICII